MAQEICVYDSVGNKATPLTVNLVKKNLNEKAFAVAVRVLLQNWRQGTVACKGRGDVSFSNRKPWRQKGTGRARAGSLRSPLWRKGGVVFGPQRRDRKLSINKEQKKVVFNNLFFELLEEDSIVCVDAVFDKKPNTKKAAQLLKSIGLEHKKVLVFLVHDDDVSYASFRNLANVNIVYFDHPNVFDLNNADCWLFLKKDGQLFNGMIEKWN